MSNKSSNFPTAQQPKLEPGEMGAMVMAMDELRNLPEMDHKDHGALEERIQYFFSWCATHDLRPTVDLLALACGVSRVTLWTWSREGGRRGEIIERAKQLLAALTEQWAVTGKINPTTAIFLQKNHFGYKDQVDVVAAPVNRLDGAFESREAILKRLQTANDPFREEPDLEALLEDVESARGGVQLNI